MNQAQRRMTGYALVGVAVLFVLVLVGRYAFREAPPPAGQPQMRIAPATPGPRHDGSNFALMDDGQTETTTSQPQDSTVTNAAVLYWQAFAMYDALSQEEKGLLGDWRTNVELSVESALCEKIRPICDLMHQAGAVTNCDWGLKRPFTDDTVKTLSPHFTSSRGIARAAIWSAAHCHKNNAVEVVSDLIATSRLGHNMPPLLIGYLVDLAIQGLTLDFTAKHASTLAGNDDARLVELFESGQLDKLLYRALEGEADIADSAAEKLSATLSEEAKREMAEMFPQTKSMDPNQLVASIREAKQWEMEYVKALQLPEAEQREWMTRLQAAEKTNPLIQEFVSVIDKVADKTRRATITSAMVVAGYAVVQDGPDALQSHLDPVTGQPFVYTETPDGFELQSGYRLTNGVPLKLQFK